MNWGALRKVALETRFALDKKEGLTCKFSPGFARGNYSFIRRLDFSDGCSWVARARVLAGSCGVVSREVDTMRLIRERTNVPVPQAFAHMERDNPKNRAGVDWMLMEYIPYNSAYDEWGGFPVHQGLSPPIEYAHKFQRDMAGHVAEISSLRFPKIGAVYFRDGHVEIGPVPGLGGPWDTPVEFLEAMAVVHESRFSLSSREQVYASETESYADHVIETFFNFLPMLAALAKRTSFRSGPFPLVHCDLFNRNILVDTDCNVQTIVDWKNAMTLPWELAMFCRHSCRPPPELHIKRPIPLEKRTEWDDVTDEFPGMLREAEEERGLDHEVSMAEADRKRTGLAYAYEIRTKYGTQGRYDSVLDLFAADALAKETNGSVIEELEHAQE
jgi:hypothetical protein